MLGMLVLAGLLPSLPMKAQTQPQLNLMPWPASVQPGSGNLRIDPSFTVTLTGHTEPRMERAVQRFLLQLSRETGIPSFAKMPPVFAKTTLGISISHAGKEVQELGEDESYVLEVTPDRANTDGPNTPGRAARPANISATCSAGVRRICSPCGDDSGHAAVPLARDDDRCEPSFCPARYFEAQHRWNGSREDERLPLAPFGKSGLPH